MSIDSVSQWAEFLAQEYEALSPSERGLMEIIPMQDDLRNITGRLLEISKGNRRFLVRIGNMEEESVYISRRGSECETEEMTLVVNSVHKRSGEIFGTIFDKWMRKCISFEEMDILLERMLGRFSSI